MNYKIALRELHSYTYKELSSPIFQSMSVSQWVSKGSVIPIQISTFSIYNGIDALYWPNNINNRLLVTQYRQVPIITVLYWPSTQLHHLVMHSWANWIYFPHWSTLLRKFFPKNYTKIFIRIFMTEEKGK